MKSGKKFNGASFGERLNITSTCGQSGGSKHDWLKKLTGLLPQWIFSSNHPWYMVLLNHTAMEQHDLRWNSAKKQYISVEYIAWAKIHYIDDKGNYLDTVNHVKNFVLLICVLSPMIAALTTVVLPVNTDDQLDISWPTRKKIIKLSSWSVWAFTIPHVFHFEWERQKPKPKTDESS